MKRDAETLAQVGQALFGTSWQTPMGDALGVNDRTFRRWVAGEFNIPDGVWNDIAKLCERRGNALLRWGDRLKAEGQ